VHDFDPTDPFPLWPGYGPELYASAKKHAAAADEWLGIPVEKIEAKLTDPKDGEERWIGRHPSIFLTPYVELRAWLEELKPEGTVVDLGAGYGRLGFVLARHYPGTRFLGYELVPERAQAGADALKRFGAGNASLRQADLNEIALPEAQLFFVYDFGSRESIARLLEKLRDRAKENNFTLVARGRGVRDAIEKSHPWLSVHDPVHGPHYSVYRSVGASL
jgi:SAM-dependent methyltransferase